MIKNQAKQTESKIRATVRTFEVGDTVVVWDHRGTAEARWVQGVVETYSAVARVLGAWGHNAIMVPPAPLAQDHPLCLAKSE